MKSRRQMNRQCFRVFKRQLPPWKLGLVAAQPPVVATQETQGQRLNKPSVRPHITFQNGRRKLKLLLQQRQAVSPKIKNQLQGKLESLAEKLPYGRTLKIGSCNVQGLKITDRQNLIKTMMAQHLDIIAYRRPMSIIAASKSITVSGFYFPVKSAILWWKMLSENSQELDLSFRLKCGFLL